MDPPNVLWFVGAFAIAFGVYALIATIPSTQSGLWRLVAAVGLFLAFCLAAALLLGRGWPVAGGLAAALAVATFPAVAIGLLQLVGAWPDVDLFDAFDTFSGYSLVIALATALVGLLAFGVTRFTFILGVSVAAVIVASQLVVPSIDEAPTGDQRAAAALVVAAGLVIVGVFLDVFGRRREAFWFHVLGLLAAAAGLTWYTLGSDSDADRGWVPMLIVATLLLLAAGPVRRATWAIFGVLGVYAALLHYLDRAFDDRRWPFAVLVLLLGCSLFAFGLLTHRYGKAWARRFVRRPPPTTLTP